MVAALMDLYRLASGTGWTNSEGWGTGEPCVDGWAGVYCCPRAYPRLSLPGGTPLIAHGCIDDNSGTAAPSELMGAGCAAALAADGTGSEARCDVVALDLEDNGLRGALTDRLDQLSSLQWLGFARNQLSGTVPASLLAIGAGRPVERLSLSDNAFDYDASVVVVERLVQRCKEGSVRCVGLPPKSCSAFGIDGSVWMVRARQPDTCEKCSDMVRQLALLGLGFALFVSGLAAYIWLIHKYPSALSKGVSTASIIIHHLQTVRILGLLQLHWPRSMELATAHFSIDFLDWGSTRPECLASGLDVKEEVGGTVLLYSLVRVLILFLLLHGVSFVQWLLKTAGWCLSWRHERVALLVDRLEMFETIVFSLQLTTSLRICLNLIDSFFAGGLIPMVAGIAGWLLLSTQLAFAIKYYCAARMLAWHVSQEERALGPPGAPPLVAGSGGSACELTSTTSGAAGNRKGRGIVDSGDVGDGGGGPWDSQWDVVIRDDLGEPEIPLPRSSTACSLLTRCSHHLRSASCRRVHCGSRSKSIQRLKRRLRYVTKRYATRAWYWQFVIWARQVLLTLLVLLPQFLSRWTFGYTPVTAVAAVASSATNAEVVSSGDGTARGGLASNSAPPASAHNASAHVLSRVGAHAIEPVALALTLGQAVVAVGIFIVFYRLHQRSQPFPYTFQNDLDSWLFLADIGVVVLGVAYTVLRPLLPAVLLPLEVCLLSLVVGSVVVSISYLCWRLWRQQSRLSPRRGQKAGGGKHGLDGDAFGSFTRTVGFGENRRFWSLKRTMGFDRGSMPTRTLSGVGDTSIATSSQAHPGGVHSLESALESHEAWNGEISPSHRVRTESTDAAAIALDADSLRPAVLRIGMGGASLSSNSLALSIPFPSPPPLVCASRGSKTPGVGGFYSYDI